MKKITTLAIILLLIVPMSTVLSPKAEANIIDENVIPTSESLLGNSASGVGKPANVAGDFHHQHQVTSDSLPMGSDPYIDFADTTDYQYDFDMTIELFVDVDCVPGPRTVDVFAWLQTPDGETVDGDKLYEWVVQGTQDDTKYFYLFVDYGYFQCNRVGVKWHIDVIVRDSVTFKQYDEEMVFVNIGPILKEHFTCKDCSNPYGTKTSTFYDTDEKAAEYTLWDTHNLDITYGVRYKYYGPIGEYWTSDWHDLYTGHYEFTDCSWIWIKDHTPQHNPGAWYVVVLLEGCERARDDFEIRQTFDFTVSCSPSSRTVTAGDSTTFAVGVDLVGGDPELVSLSCSGCPPALTCTFNPPSGYPPFTSTLAVQTSITTPPGTYTLEIIGSGGGMTHSCTVTLIVEERFDFTVSCSPSSRTVTAGDSTTYTVTVMLTSGTTKLVALSCSGCPSGASCTLSPSSGNPTFASALTVQTSPTTPPGTYTLEIIGSGGGMIHSCTVTLIVDGWFDFTVSCSPSSRTVTAGDSTTYTCTVTLTSGTSQTVSLSCSGCPAGASCTFSPSSGYPTFSSTLTVSTSPSTPLGIYTLTITGTGGGMTHSCTVTLICGACSVHLESAEDTGNTTNLGTITFDDTTYSLPNNVSKAAGTYGAQYNPPSGYKFDHWEATGGVNVSSPTSNPTTVTVSGNGTLRAIYREVVGWDVVLTASKEGYSDVSDFGVRSDATEGFDPAYDEVDPPEPPQGVVSYFWYPDNPTNPVDLRKLSTSKIPPSPPMNWTYRVKPVAIDGTMCISWRASDIVSIPSGYDVYLCVDGSCLDMRTVTEYCFTAESDTTYTFTIVVGQPRCTVTFYTAPSDIGSITFEGQTYTNGQNGTFMNGTSGLATANAPECWVFDHWETTGNITVSNSTENPTTVTITCGGTLTVVFLQETFWLTIEVTGEGTTDPVLGVYNHSCCTNVSVTAIPDPCWRFDHWVIDGVEDGSDNPITIHMDMNHTLTAVFVPEVLDFSVQVIPEKQTVRLGDSAGFIVIVTLLSGSPQNVSLGLDLPGDVGTYTFDPSWGFPDFTSSLIITTSSLAELSTYNLTVTASSDGIVHTASIQLTVKFRKVLTLTVDPYIACPGENVTFSGQLSPPPVRDPFFVYLVWRRHDTMRWKGDIKIDMDPTGYYSLTTTVPERAAPGMIDVRTFWIQLPPVGFNYAVSPIQTLTIKSPSKSQESTSTTQSTEIVPPIAEKEDSAVLISNKMNAQIQTVSSTPSYLAGAILGLSGCFAAFGHAPAVPTRLSKYKRW